MSDERPSRTCGSCGAAIGTADITCPSCGALLAAYEAPEGSDPESDTALQNASASITTPAMSNEPAVSESEVTVSADASLSSSIVEPISRPSAADPEPFDAAAALEESRRVLGMSLEQPVAGDKPEDAQPPITLELEPDAAPGTIGPTPEPREQTLVAPPASEPLAGRITSSAPVPGPEASPEPARSLLDDMASRTARPRVPPPSSSVGGGNARRTWTPAVPSIGAAPDRPDNASLWRIVSSLPILLMLCVMVSTNNFPGGLILLIVVAVLFYLIAVASRFSGRKTTTMAPPDRTNRWGR